MARDSIIQIRSEFHNGKEPDLMRLAQYLYESKISGEEEQDEG